jgi:uncharacterized protein (DUF1684 family)
MAVDAPDWIQGDGSLQDRLTLADWRRRMSALYAEVRSMTATDPAVGLAHWRSVREWMFREHPQSPLGRADRAGFRARHFDHDPALRFVVPVEPAPADDPRALGMPLPNSGTDTLSFRRIGTVRLPFPTGEERLSVFWMAGYSGGLFIPFRDATNGGETYGAGRYLIDAAKSHDLGTDEATGDLILDFNLATQPSCAFDPRWACPLAPPENWLDIEVRAGERLT